MKRRFSINIPVFNGEIYLEDCFQSLHNQTFGDFEVIVVDDGSTDSSGRICDEWASKDHRWKVCHQKNQGQMKSRLNALAMNEGEYSMFLDADDMLEKNAFELLNKKIGEYNAPDMIIFGFSSLNKNQKTEIKFPWTQEKIVDKQTIINLACQSDWLNSLCQKCIKNPLPALSQTIQRECIDMRVGEDAVQSFFYITSAKSFLFLPSRLYIYRLNDASVTHKINEERLARSILDISLLLKYKRKIAGEYGIELDGYYKSEALYLSSYLSTIYLLKRKDKKKRYDLYDCCIKMLLSKDNNDSDPIIKYCKKRMYNKIDKVGIYNLTKKRIKKFLSSLRIIKNRITTTSSVS